MKNYKLIIFDFDGTLVNSSPGIYNTANWTVKQLGLDEVEDIEQLNKFIGPPLKDCFKLTYNLDESLLDKACDLYRGKYEKSGQYEVEIFDGVENVLKQLRDKGYILAIATMKYREIVFSMLEHLDLVKYFEYIDGTNIEGTKYKAQILNEIVEHFNIDKKDSILIGDTDHDKDAAVEAKIDFLAVNYGFGYNKKTKVSKDMIGIASTPKDILSYIL
ncbi:MAG: HAD hydrolase-like protein [Sphaerochaetaceae bacterium]|nr:HAD hydrolase-like protein [Sphaerochaetaceae bacterium]